MAYIGGIGHFSGPILGAILITFLDLVLSDYTEAWLLYLGLFFIAMVMFAPGGIAGLVAVHGPAWRAGLIGRLVPAYALALGPALMASIGAMLLIEINYHLSTRFDVTEPLTLFWISVDPTSPLAWLIAVGLFAGGIVGLRRARPIVARAWADVGQHLRKRPAS
jgi:branched-chain amino acid transport system permease protein